MSTQSVNSPQFATDAANPDSTSTDATVTAHVQVTGRNV